MHEDNIRLLKQDKRVVFDFLLDERIHLFEAMPDDLRCVVIYCHGMGSHKYWASRFYQDLLFHHVGVVSFDLPGHGNDVTDFHDFSLDLCLSYLEKVIHYVQDQYQVPIYLFGSSYGGFVLLNELIASHFHINGTVLMCPAVNFLDIIERKGGMLLSDYFKEHDFVPLIGEDIGFYKVHYDSFLLGQKRIQSSCFHNVSIISGDCDRTVLCDDLKSFCDKNGLRLEVVLGGKHELYGHEKEIVRLILDIINKEI